ncbi:MAG: cytidylate kinase-like family protein [Actinomycetota bacterium]|nr:cytidylate kinase-like family protein [Actinomycetota bacterium]
MVTLAALYGAGGSVVGPRVAERLGVPFLDRAIPEAVTRETGLPERAVEDVDERPQGVTTRVMATLGRAATAGGSEGAVAGLDLHEQRLRGYIERFLGQAAASGGVALGRGGMVVLREVPWALHVHLGGAPEARIRQAMRINGVERDEAERQQRMEDRARIEYVRRAYGVDGGNPALYHLMLDSTALELEVCVGLIVTASEARRQNPRPMPVEPE